MIKRSNERHWSFCIVASLSTAMEMNFYLAEESSFESSKSYKLD